MAELNPNNVLRKRSNQENEAGSHGLKRSKELSSEILVPKEANLTKNQTQGNNIPHLLLHDLVLHLHEKKSEVKSKAERSEGEDPRACLPLHPRALRVRKKNKKPRDSILYEIGPPV